MQDIEFVNGFVEGDRLVLLYRDAAGVLMQRQLPAEFASFYERAKLGEEDLRDLTQNRFVRGYTQEGDWLRVRWADRWTRRKACSTESPFQQRGIVAFEGDVGPVQRFFADTGAKIAVPRRCYVDFETDSRVSPRKAAEGEARILSWVIVWECGPGEGVDVSELLGDVFDGRPRDGREVPDLRGQLGRVDYVIGCLDDDTDEAERELIESFYDVLQEIGVDLLVAWNGDGFDFPMLPVRVERSRASIKEPRRYMKLDQMVLYERMNRNAAESGDEKVSLKLDAIGHKFLGVGKDKTFDARRTFHAWAAGGEERERMLRYMVRDGVVQAGIEARLGHIDQHIMICQVCGLFPDSWGMNPTRFVDAFMLRRAAQQGTHFATKQYDQEEEEQFAGAWVMEPKAHGFVENVHVCDFKSLYPSVIITWNMSPETKSRTCPINGPIPPNTCRSPSNRVGFRTDVDGMLTAALKELIRLRDHYKKLKTTLPPNTPEWKDADRKSMAYKVAANSFYGVMGSPFSRFFDRDIAEGVSQNGVWLIKKTSDAAEGQRWSFQTIYGDTDSLYSTGDPTPDAFDAFVRWCNEELYPQLLRDVGCVDNRISLAYEKQFERLVFTSAKKYVGRLRHYGWNAKTNDWNWATAESEPEVKGLEWRRGDANQIAREMQWEAIKLICDQDRNVAMDPAKYVEIADRYKQRVLEAPLTVEEVKQAKALSKEPDEYVSKKKKDGTDSAVQPHVRVARILEARGESIVVNSKIDYVIVDGSKDAESGLVAIPAEDYDGQNVDRFYLWEHLVWPPTQRLLEAAFPARDWKPWNRVRPSKRERRAAAGGQIGLFGDAKVQKQRLDTASTEALRALHALTKNGAI